MSEFTSQPLYTPLGPSDIRILILQPGRADDPIRCSLKQVTLHITPLNEIREQRTGGEFQIPEKSDSSILGLFRGSRTPRQPSYEALSYCWGPDEVYKSIDVDGHVIPVRRNLWWALYHLRYNRWLWARALWVDAICINQSDIPERSAQVSIVHSVYNSASKVLIWLGEETSDSSAALKAIVEFHGRTPKSWSSVGYRVDRFSERSLGYKIDFCHEHKEKFLSLFGRPYWSRLWVVQEVYFATRLVIHCGSQLLDWVDLVHFVDTCGDLYEDDVKDVLPQSLRRLTGFCLERPTGPENLIFMSRHFYCSDPRDKIFGLIGLLEARKRGANPARDYKEKIFVTVDYSKDSRQLYLDGMIWYTQWIGDHFSHISKFSHDLQLTLGYPFSQTTRPVVSECDARLLPHVFILLRWKQACDAEGESPNLLPSVFTSIDSMVGQRILEFHLDKNGQLTSRGLYKDKALFRAPEVIRPFVTENGEVLFGPSNIKKGDRVSRYNYSWNWLLLRPDYKERTGRLVGRAIRKDGLYEKFRM
jgi:hypothetical protein